MNVVKNKLKMTVLSVTMSVALGTVGMQMVQADNGASINLSSNSLSYAGSSSEDRLTLSVAGPDMDVVSVSATSSIYWDLPNNLADGKYNYELSILTPSLDGKEENASNHRINGSFEVVGGVITSTSNDVEAAEEEGTDPNLSQNSSNQKSLLETVAINIADFIFPTANAADLTADSGLPKVFFEKSGTQKYQLMGGANSPLDSFLLYRTTGGQYVLRITAASPFGTTWGNDLFTIDTAGSSSSPGVTFLSLHKNHSAAFTSDSNGDINLANSSVFIDKAANFMGIGTTTPAEEIHIASENPAIRFEDFGGSTVWVINADVTSSEFDIQNDTTGQSIFRIEANALSNSLVIDSSSSIGLGTNSPTAALHINKADAAIKVEDTNAVAGNRQLLELENNGGIGMRMRNTNANAVWDFNNTNSGNFTASRKNTGGFEFEVQGNGRTKVRSFGTLIMDMRADGNLHIPTGDVIVAGTTLNVPDYVFEHDYKLMPLDELKGFVSKNKHLPNVASEAEIKKSKQVSVAKSQMRHLEKIEELTLYTIEQHEQINSLKSELVEQTTELNKKLNEQEVRFQERLASLEKLVTNLAMGSGQLGKGAKVAIK